MSTHEFPKGSDKGEEETGSDVSDNDDGDEDYKDEGEGDNGNNENTGNYDDINMNPWSTGLPQNRDNYSINYARSILRVNNLANSNQVFKYVTREIFKDMKFTAGDEELERELIQLAINDRSVVIGDSRIPHEAIVEEYYREIPKSITLLRTRTINLARKKFMRKLLIDDFFFP